MGCLAEQLAEQRRQGGDDQDRHQQEPCRPCARVRPALDPEHDANDRENNRQHEAVRYGSWRAPAYRRRKYTGPQHASLGVASAAGTWSQRARSPTA